MTANQVKQNNNEHELRYKRMATSILLCTRARSAKRVLPVAIVILSVRPSVRLSVTTPHQTSLSEIETPCIIFMHILYA